MERGFGHRAPLGLRTLHAAGTLGALGDARLLERFLEHEGPDREDAFAVLVHRHGPSVIGICRRMLGGPANALADADDAFQAVFLVLARKAGSLRRVDDLGPWLRAVAVRVSQEARRRSAKLRSREGGRLVDFPAAAAIDPDLFELRAFLDEELQRLPRRYREPLRLCELEGATRHDAARRLGIPEGTLSTRLARGRVMLRDRLTRRGVAVGALGAMFPAPAKAGSLGALADASTRLALKFAARDAAAGSVPATVASLAEGALLMIQTAKLKTILLAASALVVACLAAGLVAGRASPPAEAPAKLVAQAAEPPKGEKPSEPLQARGVVVDEAGNPVAGAEVRVDAFRPYERLGVTGPDGAFAIPARGDSLSYRPILVRVDDGRKLGVFQYGYNLSRAESEAAVRIIAKPSREVAVHVADAGKAPIEGAVVEVVGDYSAVAHATTGADGTAKLSVPIDSKVSWIVAKKEAVGFDYAELGKFDEFGRLRESVAAEELPDSVALTLESPRVARIKAVDTDGKPLAGVGFHIWLLKKEGRRSEVNYFSRLHGATTDADGIATFDWLPPSVGLLQFWPDGDGYAHRRVIVEEGRTEPVVATLVRNETIRGRVVLPDGSPAKDVQVVARGTGQGMDSGGGTVRSDDEGRYEISAAPNEAYAVFVDDEDWAAPSRLDVVVRPGKPVDGVDFQLAKGTIIKGTVTIGNGERPAAGESIRLTESGAQAPREFREAGDNTWRQILRQFGETTDAEGRYAIRVGPGTYTLSGPARTESETIEVTDQPEIVHDFHMPRPAKGPLAGRVIAGIDGKPVAGARIEIVSENPLSFPLPVTADDEGRFQTDRFLDTTILCAKSPDGSLGALVEIGPDDPEVVIPLTPTASATGLLLDEQGEPARNQELSWGRRVYSDAEHASFMHVFAPKVVSDDQGRFTLPALVVGQKYEISVKRDDVYRMAGVAEPQQPGPMDLGTLQVGAYEGDEQKAAASSFLPDAPDAGAVAPALDATTLDGAPVSLKDFAGKFVLLDFWATWCGPCLGEIPNLQDIHDTFAEDERFALLSLSIDETIDEPRKFQETRKLPWNQGFLKGEFDGPKAYGVRAIPAFVLVGPDGKIVARGMRGEEIKKAVAEALEKAE